LFGADRRAAAMGVVALSDWVGRANFPDQSIWDAPNEALRMALSQNSRGNVTLPAKTILLAAVLTKIAADKLSDYIESTTLGARRIGSILSVLERAGKIAEVVLLVDGAVTGVMRLMASGTAETAAGEGAAKVARKGINTPEASWKTNYAGREAFEQTVDRAGITLDTEGGADAMLNRYDLAFQSRLKQWVDFVTNELTANPDSPVGDGLAVLERANAKFGMIWAEMP
jgi:hypothetical protein